MALDLFNRRAREDHERYGDRLPPGQKLTDGWPVLQYGNVPAVDIATWKFSVVGLVDQELHFTWDEFLALPQTTIRSDIHCVTHWSKFDNDWTGVRFRDLLAKANVDARARYVMVHSYGGYTTNVSLQELTDEDVLFAYQHNGEALTREHGWPLRLVIPKRQVGTRHRPHGQRQARLLGDVRLPHARRPVEGRTLLLADSRRAATALATLTRPV
jgi:DMSO/TMAO reductase YedYZ molybdopterin-dependent catalytic subunit